MKNEYLNELKRVDLWERCEILFSRLKKPVVELWDGITKGTLPWARCLSACLFFELVLLFRLDQWAIAQTRFAFLYPKTMQLYHLYYFVIITSPFSTWACFQARKRERLNKILHDIFKSSGLQNNLGNLPFYVFDRAIDATTRKLRVTRAVLPMKAFQDAKDSLQGGLSMYIDEFRENRSEGTVDIIYSDKPMPEICKLYTYKGLPTATFYVGCTRSKEIKVSLNSVPHLLVAGQTGGGKSTFIRQFTVTLYLNDENIHFTFIDLKAGLESQFFENLKRVEVHHDIGMATYFLSRLAKTLQYRMNLLKANKCKDVLEYYKLPKEKRVEIPVPDREVRSGLFRHVIIVDEAAELFLAGGDNKASDVQEAKRVLSQVARQGRSIGVHLLIATQRPDSRALDPQIKANLTGTISFQMVNDTSSILVLGNGRATDLPPIPGRAIWKSGMEMVEIQTPYLDPQETEELLKSHYREKKTEKESEASKKDTRDTDAASKLRNSPQEE